MPRAILQPWSPPLEGEREKERERERETHTHRQRVHRWLERSERRGQVPVLSMHPTWLALCVNISSQGEERASERASERAREREQERVGGGELEVMLLSRDEIQTHTPRLSYCGGVHVCARVLCPSVGVAA